MSDTRTPVETPVAKLRQHPENPRRGDTEAIKASIEANGWFGSITAQTSTGYVLAGNHRLEAALELGIESLPVVWLDVDDEEARRILLNDNRTSDEATYDYSELKDVLDDLGDLTGTGYTEDDVVEVNKIVAELHQMPDPEDAMPATPGQPIGLKEVRLTFTEEELPEFRELVAQMFQPNTSQAVLVAAREYVAK